MGHLDYAVTAHRAQGITPDHAQAVIDTDVFGALTAELRQADATGPSRRPPRPPSLPTLPPTIGSEPEIGAASVPLREEAH